ncbi:MAG TPA: copper homeostasis protein CutC [Edaphobacter sp.]|nr:copper homeostasis protein CutC [Edaphobacter sp.]
MGKITFELCAESLQACLAAGEGGADRIELCSALSEDGLTPSHSLIKAAVERSGLPVYVLLRPRAGDFVYNDEELALMREDLLHARSLGASGFVLGALHRNFKVDMERTRELVELAAPLEVTFHRAFDLTPSLEDALEDVIAAGCRRILTSGGEADVVAGTANLRRLVERASDRIAITAGGGLRIENAASVMRQSGVCHFHGSLRRSPLALPTEQNAALPSASRLTPYVDPQDIRALLDELHNDHCS